MEPFFYSLSSYFLLKIVDRNLCVIVDVLNYGKREEISSQLGYMRMGGAVLSPQRPQRKGPTGGWVE